MFCIKGRALYWFITVLFDITWGLILFVGPFSWGKKMSAGIGIQDFLTRSEKRVHCSQGPLPYPSVCNDSTKCRLESRFLWPPALFSPKRLSTNHLAHHGLRLEAEEMNTPAISFWQGFDTWLMGVANSMTSRLLALLKEIPLKHPWGYGFLLIANRMGDAIMTGQGCFLK